MVVTKIKKKRKTKPAPPKRRPSGYWKGVAEKMALGESYLCSSPGSAVNLIRWIQAVGANPVQRKEGGRVRVWKT